MYSYMTEHDPSLGVSPTESPEASPNPTSEATEAHSFLLITTGTGKGNRSSTRRDNIGRDTKLKNSSRRS
jgi:hypothetical protein